MSKREVIPRRVRDGRRCLRRGTTLCANRCFMLCIAVHDVPHFGLADEQVKVLRHDDVSQHNKLVLFAHFFENSQKQITPLIGVEPRLSLIATAGDEVQISGAVVTPQTLGHEGRLNPVRSERCDGQSAPGFPKLISVSFVVGIMLG
jgi:hypothetical protein